MEPDLNGLTPDFEATVDGIRVFFECTVVQSSGSNLSADKNEAIIKKSINSIDTGRFRLWIEFRSHGPKSPPTKPLKKCIKSWVDALDPDVEILRIKQGGTLEEQEWQCEGWKIHIKAVPLNTGSTKGKDHRSIGVEFSTGILDTDQRILHALDKKSSKYKISNQPYVLVLSHNLKRANIELSDMWENSVMDALFGHRQYVIPRDCHLSVTPGREEPSFDGFFGSPEKPENRRVSAILFKRELTLTNPSTGDSEDRLPPWVLYHHPWAECPLPRGLFPFAADVDVTKTPHIVDSIYTLKELLGLPDIAIDKYPLKGGMWKALVG